MCQALGYRVVGLHRIRVMHIELGDLQVGQWRDLTERERRELLETVSRSGEMASGR
jgi:23S rRNA pseudouridine2604 synthase